MLLDILKIEKTLNVTWKTPAKSKCVSEKQLKKKTSFYLKIIFKTVHRVITGIVFAVKFSKSNSICSIYYILFTYNRYLVKNFFLIILIYQKKFNSPERRFYKTESKKRFSSYDKSIYNILHCFIF